MGHGGRKPPPPPPAGNAVQDYLAPMSCVCVCVCVCVCAWGTFVCVGNTGLSEAFYVTLLIGNTCYAGSGNTFYLMTLLDTILYWGNLFIKDILWWGTLKCDQLMSYVLSYICRLQCWWKPDVFIRKTIIWYPVDDREPMKYQWFKVSLCKR